MHVDLVDPQKLDRARRLLGTTTTRATLDMALELLLAQSDLFEVDGLEDAVCEPLPPSLDWE